MEINLKRQLVPFEWLQYPREIQNLFIETFGIKRSGGTNVIDNKVISDGHTNEDLSVVSLKSLQEFNETDDDHWDNLLKLTINKMENGFTDNQVSTPISGTVAASINQGATSEASGSEKAKRPYKRKTPAVS